MRAQVADGHEVTYLFSGRHYPFLERSRLKRWHSGGVRMYELIGSPNQSHPELGTREPLRDLDEPAGERAFAVAIRDMRPDVVHIHELAGLPSSLIEHAKAAGVPVVLTLHDYKTVCASVRLLDADGNRCTRLEVGQDCARNCAGSPAGRAHQVEATMDYERERAKRAFGADRADFSFAAPIVGRIRQRLHAGGARTRSGVPSEGHGASRPAPARDYQRRRDINLRRLALCDRLIAPSARVAQVVSALGVDQHLFCVQRLTLPHLERLVPARASQPRSPLTFVILGGCASPSKGSQAVLEAVTILEAGERADYRLIVAGHVEPGILEPLSRLGSVVLTGPYGPEDLDHLLDRADVGIVPSVWEEAHGFVGIEMLAKGLPVIGSALGGIPEYVLEGVTGWLNDGGTGSGLAALMRAALDDPARVERLRHSVRQRRAELVRPMAEHVAEVQALYAEVLSERALPRDSHDLRDH
jgi:glycosyltransferase involved in cell wall biosynthesis